MNEHDFEDRGRSHGNAYTSDLEYMNGMLGAPRWGKCYDWTLRRWVMIKFQPLAGHRDRVTPADVDVQLQEEHLYEQSRTSMQATLADTRATKNRNAMALYVAHMQEHGPQTVKTLKTLGSWKNRNSIITHLKEHEDTYVRFSGRAITDDRWGIHGQEFDMSEFIHRAGAALQAKRVR
jgi:hypothetical protein